MRGDGVVLCHRQRSVSPLISGGVIRAYPHIQGKVVARRPSASWFGLFSSRPCLPLVGRRRRGSLSMNHGHAAKLGEAARDMKAEQVDAVVVIGFPTVLACKVANVPTVVAFGCGISSRDTSDRLARASRRGGHRHFGRRDNTFDQASRAYQAGGSGSARVAMLWNRDDLGMTMRYDASRLLPSRLE